jgi:hypothetical protein
MKESQGPNAKESPPSLKAKVAVVRRPPDPGRGWKKQALAGLPDVFGNGREQMPQQANTEKNELYKKIGH